MITKFFSTQILIDTSLIRLNPAINLVLGNDPLYPGHHLGDPGVHPRVLLLSTPNTPGHNANLFTRPIVGTIKKWPTRITLNRKETHLNVIGTSSCLKVIF